MQRDFVIETVQRSDVLAHLQLRQYVSAHHRLLLGLPHRILPENWQASNAVVLAISLGMDDPSGFEKGREREGVIFHNFNNNGRNLTLRQPGVLKVGIEPGEPRVLRVRLALADLGESAQRGVPLPVVLGKAPSAGSAPFVRAVDHHGHLVGEAAEHDAGRRQPEPEELLRERGRVRAA